MTANELPLLTKLFKYKNIENMIRENAENIERGAADIFALFLNDRLIGELHVKYESADELEAVRGRRAYLFAFRIHKKFQNKGYGKYLFKSVIGKLAENGYTEFTVGVEDDNETAIHIYKSLGFNEIIERKQEEYEGYEYEYNLYLMTVI